MNLFEDNGAQFSDCKEYRYMLWRIWNPKKPKALIIGLNPSTANARHDDPTIRRLKTLMRKIGYGGFYMCNLYPQITPFPKNLNLERNYSQLIENRAIIKGLAEKVNIIIFAWGAFPEAELEGDYLSLIFAHKAWCFGHNQNGSPKHPLYLSNRTKLIKYQS